MGSERATAQFQITAWDEEPVQEALNGGVAITRARVIKTLAGDITGSSVAWLTMSVVGETSMAYVGVELFNVTVHDRAGTFVLVHDALSTGTSAHTWWTVQGGTGTGELAGITGTAAIDPRDDGTHLVTLDYSLDARPAEPPGAG